MKRLELGTPMRRVKLSPYLRGRGPTFTLTLYELPWTAGGLSHSHTYIGYRLTQHDRPGHSRDIFVGKDFGVPGHQTIDGDDAVHGILGFLTLRPGDTDPDYFDKYTPSQRAFASEHAEALSLVNEERFGHERRTRKSRHHAGSRKKTVCRTKKGRFTRCR